MGPQNLKIVRSSKVALLKTKKKGNGLTTNKRGGVQFMVSWLNFKMTTARLMWD
jgi:hypothetical protein